MENYARFVRSDIGAHDVDQSIVDGLAARLASHLERSLEEIRTVHVHGAQSSAVQSIASRVLIELGFREEVVLTPQDGLVTRARPDFLYPVGSTGIIAEVERGGTTTNNHDLKDLWKAHIAPDVHHLFLVVPRANWNGSGAARERPFPRVVSRLGAFFGEPRREVDVRSLHIFGYGDTGFS